MLPFAVGVDAGGTTARALLARGDEVLGVGEAPGGNLRQVGAARALAGIVAAVEAAFLAAGLPFDPAHCAVHAGLAGLATPADGAALAAEAHPFGRLTAESDAALALGAAFAGGPGVLLIVGTGCIALGRAADGRTGRRLGWGFPLEPLGGAGLGLAALRLALLDREAGRDGVLARAAGARFADVRAAIEWARRADAGAYGAFAPALFDAADAGDDRAIREIEAWRAGCRDAAFGLARELGGVDVHVHGGLAGRLGEMGVVARFTPLEWAVRRAAEG